MMPLEQFETLVQLLLELDQIAPGECDETVDTAWEIQEGIYRTIDAGDIPTIASVAAFERAVYLAQDCLEWATREETGDTVGPTEEELEELPVDGGGHRWAVIGGVGLLAAAGLGYLATRRR
jgi:hypothetical protein